MTAQESITTENEMAQYSDLLRKMRDVQLSLFAEIRVLIEEFILQGGIARVVQLVRHQCEKLVVAAIDCLQKLLGLEESAL